MSRLSISLSDGMHRALKLAAAQRNMTIGEIIEASLDLYGIKSTEDAASLVAKARSYSNQPEDQAMALALAETRAARQ